MHNVLVPEARAMGKRKRKGEGGERAYNLDASGNARIEFVAPPEWLAELDARAKVMGLARSQFIRLACNRLLDAERRAEQ